MGTDLLPTNTEMAEYVAGWLRDQATRRGLTCDTTGNLTARDLVLKGTTSSAPCELDFKVEYLPGDRGKLLEFHGAIQTGKGKVGSEPFAMRCLERPWEPGQTPTGVATYRIFLRLN